MRPYSCMLALFSCIQNHQHLFNHVSQYVCRYYSKNFYHRDDLRHDVWYVVGKMSKDMHFPVSSNDRRVKDMKNMCVRRARLQKKHISHKQLLDEYEPFQRYERVSIAHDDDKNIFTHDELMFISHCTSLPITDVMSMYTMSFEHVQRKKRYLRARYINSRRYSLSLLLDNMKTWQEN